MRKQQLIIYALLLWIAPLGIQADTVEFVRRKLGLNATNFVLGSALASFPGARQDSANVSDFYTDALPAQPAPDANAEWYRTALSDAYEKQYPGRRLRFGFKAGRLVAVDVGMGRARNHIKPTKELLDEIYAEAKTLGAKFDAGGDWILEDKQLLLRSQGYCSGAEHHVADIRITLPRKP